MKFKFLLTASALLAGCSTAPTYNKPPVDMPVTWQTQAPWRTGAPNDLAAKGPWWERFNDTQLNALEEKAMLNNQTLAGANARLAQARATLVSTSASLFPQLSMGTRLLNQRISANRPLTNYKSPNFSTIQNDILPSLAVSYEVDLAGRVQSLVEGATASSEQSAADLENTKLLLTADLAINYFNLRALDADLEVLSKSIDLQKKLLVMATDRHDLGATSGLEMAQQQALLDTTLSQVHLLQRQRAVYEDAIATLTGTPAPQFSIAPQARLASPPDVPLGIPSDVLERRPDVAFAERAMATANAQIGVANAAFYPSVILGPTFGLDSSSLPKLFTAPSMVWSLGVSATQVLFDGGRIKANLDFSRAGYDVTVANYRRVILTAMQEVQDGISGVASLDLAYKQTLTAVTSATKVFNIASERYEGGIANYLDVITAQQTLLNSERQASQILGQRLVTTVVLIKALGGGWQVQASATP